MLSLFGLLLGLALLVWLTMRGTELLVAAPLSALVVGLTASLPLFPHSAGGVGTASIAGGYMAAFAAFIQTWFFMFLLGALFGKAMEASGAADSVAQWIVDRLGMKHAAAAVVFACAVLTYGGVSLFVVAFSVYPMAISLFRQANLPRRFIPATLGFGSVTFTMTSAGSPEIQNWIPIKFLGTSPYAAWEVSLVVAIFMILFGHLWLTRALRRATQNGEVFIPRASDPVIDAAVNLPAPWRGLLALLVVLVTSWTLHGRLAESALIVALGAGLLATIALHPKVIRNLGGVLAMGALGALIAIANTAAVVGFGGVAKLTEGFQLAVQAMTNVPGSPLVGAAIAVALIAGMTGSASGGQTIALPLIAPHYIDQGVDPEQLHRVVAIASGGLDTFPHNGYVVTTIRAICQETYAAAYPMMMVLTMIVPFCGLVLAVALFSL